MNRATTLAAIALATFGFATSSFSHQADAGHRSRAFAIGLGTLAAATIIASQNRSYSSPRLTCGELLDRCYEGRDWACRRFENRC